MQKWLPDAFAEDAVVVGLSGQPESFESETETPRGQDAADWTSALFIGETGFADTDTLLGHLTEKERGLICERIRGEIAEDLAAEQAKLAEEFNAKLAEQERQQAEAMGKWCQTFKEEMDAYLAEGAAASVRLAVQLAERIIRARVEIDQGLLTRAIETTLFKIVDGSQITLTVNPEDAVFIKADPQALAQLAIKEIKEDRRIERGGCRVHAGDLEWDATLTSQLETLARVVEEAIAVSRAAPQPPSPSDEDPGDGEDHEPGLE